MNATFKAEPYEGKVRLSIEGLFDIGVTPDEAANMAMVILGAATKARPVPSFYGPSRAAAPLSSVLEAGHLSDEFSERVASPLGRSSEIDAEVS